MSDTATPHVGDLGTKVQYQFVAASTGLALDISSASVFSLVFEKPDGSNVTVTQASSPNPVTKLSGGTTGTIEFIVPATGDGGNLWSAHGTWRVQGYVEVGNFKARGQVKTFVVERKVEA